MRIVFGRSRGRHCVARTCSTSVVPMPNASVPNAPWVEVWLSPHTIVMPGCVSPSSGPMTCTIPSLPASRRMERDAELGAVRTQRLELRARERVPDRPGLGRHVVVHRRDREVRSADAVARRGADPRMPAATSPRGSGGGRCRAAPARPRPRERRGSPRCGRRASAAWVATVAVGLAFASVGLVR